MRADRQTHERITRARAFSQVVTRERERQKGREREGGREGGREGETEREQKSKEGNRLERESERESERERERETESPARPHLPTSLAEPQRAHHVVGLVPLLLQPQQLPAVSARNPLVNHHSFIRRLSRIHPAFIPHSSLINPSSARAQSVRQSSLIRLSFLPNHPRCQSIIRPSRSERVDSSATFHRRLCLSKKPEI
jgi:hypothetical protein